MKDTNRPVNDIFQNDNSSRNKTKTILLLTIVAVILISVFLIIAWVMTRDNPIQTLNQDGDQAVLSGSKQPLAFAHNLESENTPSPDSNTNPLNIDISAPQETQDPLMSNVPPIGVQNVLPPVVEPQPAAKDSFENDERYQAAVRNLEQQHIDKQNAAAKKEEMKKEEAKKEEAKREQPQKVLTPLPLKETTIARAPDPTKTTQKKEPEKPAPKQEPAKTAESAKPATQPTPTPKPKEADKPAPKPEPAKTAEATKPAEPKAENKTIQRPQNNVVNERQGKSPEKGHYIQVGALAQNKITPEFLNKISKYNYRILTIKEGDTTKSKYLIGPYKSQQEAKQLVQKIRTEIAGDAFYVDHTK